MKTTCFRLDWPPSVNNYWRMWKGRMVLTTDGRKYREAAFCLSNVQFDTPVAVQLDLIMPDRRRRDIDNVAKAVLDAIGHAGIYIDDSQVHVLHIERCGIESPGCVDVTIAEISGDA